ncbi:MAG: T9SS type A sorting domain-containing protein, partial [bacterium]
SRNVALSWSDYDQDGDMDLFLSHFHNDLQSGEIVSNFLFRNETVNNWLEVDLEPRNSTNAVGVRVLAYTQDKTLKRETTYGSIQAPQNANRLLIGLSLKSSLDSLVVVWPSGQQDKATSIGANRIVVAKEGEGIVTAVEEPAEGPKNFQLHQNYPNPFNPETTIEYELAQPGPVRLSIYNLLGQRLRTLVDEWQPAGSYRVRWSGSVEGGARSVASGVYVVELKVGEKVQRRKMLVIR